MDKKLAMLEETWNLFVGSVTPEEFLATEQPNSTISEIVERYLRSFNQRPMETWDLVAGSMTPEEFLATEQPNSTLSEIVERYLRSVGGSTECAEDIEEYLYRHIGEDIEEYLYRHIENVRDDVLGHLERLGFEDIPVSINNICLEIDGTNYRPWRLLDILESLQTCKPSDLVRALFDYASEA